MKNKLIFLFSLFLLISCGKEEKLVFENMSYSNDNCTPCPEINIEVPQALDNRKVSTTINSSIREEVISLLSYEEEVEIADIPSAITSFNNSYQNLLKMFPDELVPWEAKIDAQIAYENNVFVTIRLDSYIFTGGAHGYGSTRFLNFDKQSGLELTRKDLFKNHRNFVDFAEERFRKQENIQAWQGIHHHLDSRAATPSLRPTSTYCSCRRNNSSLQVPDWGQTPPDLRSALSGRRPSRRHN